MASLKTLDDQCTYRLCAGRKNWTFAGSDEGGRRAAAIYTVIATAKSTTSMRRGLTPLASR